MFGASQAVLLNLPIDRPIFLREYANGYYSVILYFMSKLFREVPQTILLSFIQLLVAYFLIGFTGNFFYLGLTLSLVGLATSSTAYMLGAAVSTPSQASRL